MRKFTLLLVSLLLAGAQMLQAQRTITGTVISAEDNQGIPGVSVSVKGTTTGTTTDINGRYSLNVPNDGVSLVFNYVGMATQEIAVAGKNTIDVTMQSTATDLEGVVIVGYGSGKKIGTTVGSVAQVSSESIKDRPTANVMDALQGKVAGLQIYTSSGEPDATASIRLHGVGSFGASNSPLYVLDGVPVSAGAIRSFNPNDYESITVLKDASATSIYGSRAANGVIFMTSKRGSLNSPATITVNASTGFSRLANDDFFGVMNSAQLKAHWLDLGLEDPADIEAVFAAGHDTKWSDIYYNSNAPTSQVDISVAGGGGRTTYYISGSNFYQQGTTPRSAYNRSTLRTNIETTVKEWFRMGGNIVGSYSERENNAYTFQGSNNLNGGLFWLAEPYVTPYDSNGNIMDRIPGLFGSTGTSPQYLAEKMPNKAKEYRGNANMYVQITPFEGLVLRSQAGLDGVIQNSRSARMPSMVTNLSNGTLTEGYTYNMTRIITNTAEYKFNIDKKHFVSVLVGQEATDFDAKSFSASASGLQVDQIMHLNAGNPELTTATSSSSAYLYNSYFGRVDYSFNDKYYADFSVRNDASSRFGANHRNATFFSIGAMWNIKAESFMSDIKPVTDLKLKAGYGTSGNSEIGNYDHVKYNSQAANYDAAMSYIMGNEGNPELTWETQKLFTAAVDIELYRRFRVNFEYYNRQTTNMLMDVPYALTTGIAERTENTASIRNHGLDITADVDILKGKDYYLNFSFTFNTNKSKVLELFDGRQVWIVPNTGVTYVVGKPVEFYYPIFYRVDPADGQQEWYLPGEDFTVTQKDPTKTTKTYTADLEQSTGIARYAPTAGGFGLSGGWKGFAVQADFAFVWKKYLINNDRYFAENAYSFYGYNQSIRVTDYWKNPGDVKDYPDWRQGQVMEFDTHLLEDASFLRMKNLTVSYSVPMNILSKTKIINGVRVYFTARNLLTFTKYLGPDPEIDSNLTYGAYPNSKQFIFGAEIKF